MADPLKPPTRYKCRACAGTKKTVIHCATVVPCRRCKGRGYFLRDELELMKTEVVMACLYPNSAKAFLG